MSPENVSRWRSRLGRGRQPWALYLVFTTNILIQSADMVACQVGGLPVKMFIWAWPLALILSVLLGRVVYAIELDCRQDPN